MRRLHRAAAGVAAMTCGISVLPAQVSSNISQVRPLAATQARSEDGTVAAINALRAVGPTVFVNDRASERVVMLDRNLRVVKVALDGSPATGAYYGGYGNRMIAMPGDSTLFIDGASPTFTVLDADGRVARRSAVPASVPIAQVFAGGTAFDARGRIVYRGSATGRVPPVMAPLLRLDLGTGRVDTITFIRTHEQRYDTRESAGWVHSVPVLNPAPVVDEWAMLSDGTIAVVRGDEYRVDYFEPEGKVSKGTAIPTSRRTLSVADKVALIDSSRAVRNRMLAAGLPLGREVAPLPGAVFYSAPPITAGSDGSRSTSMAATSSPFPDEWVRPQDLPDRLPAFLPGAVRADAEGNLWIQTIAESQASGGLIYDVIDRSGARVDRVQVPAGAGVVGFAPGGVVYLAQRDASGLHLVRTNHELPKPRP